jgi:polar amino acid transport system substrate-binding protein
LPASIRDSGILVVGTDAEYPPCEYYPSGSASMVGFEPDLWNAMASVLGLKAEPVSIGFDSLIPGVLDGRFPVAIECIDDTAAREAQVSMVDYMYDQDGVLSLASEASITTNPLSLCGLTAGEEEGNIEATRVNTLLTPYCTANGKSAVSEDTYSSEANVLTALESGRINFTLDDLAAESYLAASSPVKLQVQSDDLLPRDYIAIATQTSATGLDNALVGALKVIQQNGEYSKIMAKWGVQDLALATPGINLATSQPIPTPTA